MAYRRAEWTWEGIDQTHSVTEDRADPRSLGLIWCREDEHQESQWMSNQYCIWKTCKVCALRLHYFPRRTWVGQYRASSPLPEVVHRAAEIGKQRETEHTAKNVEALLQLAAAEFKLGRPGKGKAKAKAAGRGHRPPSPQTPLDDPDDPPEHLGQGSKEPPADRKGGGKTAQPPTKEPHPQPNGADAMTDVTEPTSKLRRRPVQERGSAAMASCTSYTHRGLTWSELTSRKLEEVWAKMISRLLEERSSRSAAAIKMEMADKILKICGEEALKEKAAQKKANDNPKKKTREPEEYIFLDPEEQDTTVEDTMPKIYKKVASRSKTPAAKKTVRMATLLEEEIP